MWILMQNSYFFQFFLIWKSILWKNAYFFLSISSLLMGHLFPHFKIWATWFLPYYGADLEEYSPLFLINEKSYRKSTEKQTPIIFLRSKTVQLNFFIYHLLYIAGVNIVPNPHRNTVGIKWPKFWNEETSSP